MHGREATKKLDELQPALVQMAWHIHEKDASCCPLLPTLERPAYGMHVSCL